LKIPKELKTGIIAIVAIGLLVSGVNFLKGNSFFGGDDIYYAYFPSSGGIAPASSVTVNGVSVGKVMSVEYAPSKKHENHVKVTFNIQNRDVKIPIGSKVEVGSLDLFNKAVLLTLNENTSQGFYKPKSEIMGTVAQDVMAQVQSYVDPVGQKLQTIMGSVDQVVSQLASLWDTTATSELEGSIQEVKIAIKRFSNVVYEVETLVLTEKDKLDRIISHVESITNNLKLSNEKIAKIIGNTEKITDDMVSADFKSVVSDAKKVINSLNSTLEDTNKGNGTLGKLLKDEKLYNELVESNQALQSLLEDLEANPKRYVSLSLFGGKTKGVPIKKSDERKLKNLLDSIPNE
jgi:phospholipid/cholesterol/gamma-HCH transport system substrate-binding protein